MKDFIEKFFRGRLIGKAYTLLVILMKCLYPCCCRLQFAQVWCIRGAGFTVVGVMCAMTPCRLTTMLVASRVVEPKAGARDAYANGTGLAAFKSISMTTWIFNPLSRRLSRDVYLGNTEINASVS